MTKFIIYALIDPRTGFVRYIGKSCSGLERAREHARQAAHGSRTYCARWIRQLQALGLRYEIIAVEDVGFADELAVRERWWIAFGRAWGCELTNLTDGGEGAFGRVWSPEMRANLRAAHARPEVKLREAESSRAALARPEVRARRSTALRIRHAVLRDATPKEFCRRLIREGTLTNAEIYACMVTEFGGERAGKRKHIAWYRWQIRHEAREVAAVQWGPM